VIEGNEPVGVVTIGRNEGERLRRCLRSLIEQGAAPIVYVDSGSTDGSAEFARSVGVDVVDLDMSQPFTMARGRNAGLRHLLTRYPELRLVQFVDGDCEVEPNWIATARDALLRRPELAAVTGRRRERYPEASLYNRLIDMEWEGAAGEVRATGGDVMFRVDVLRQVGLFNEGMIAGEEPELCVRVRAAGYKLLRLEQPMTRHDAAMFRYAQWWQRAKRGGHARAEGMALHGRSPERHNVRETISALVYGFAVPLLTICAAVAASWLATWRPSFALGGVVVVGAVAVGYAALGIRIYRHRRGLGNTPEQARLYALFCVQGKVPEALGVLTYVWNRARGRRTPLMDYKQVPPA
jgi:GT2 family glycosyltransferase